VNPFEVTPSTGLAVIGRASPSGPLDDISLQKGRWASRPGEIDIDPRYGNAAIGGVVSVTSAPGNRKLTVVGWASSITGANEAWVAPGQLAALRAKGAPVQEEMLYDFTSPGNAAEVAADLAEITRALPAGAVADSISWLDAGGSIAQEQGINTPFVVAFAVIALVLAVLITANLVSAAVVAAYRRIGVLKSIGFTPLQVTETCLAQIGLPALAGAIIGTILGDRWVLPKLNGGPFRALPVPLWINLAVPAGMLALTGLAALAPASRAGRLSVVAAIAAGLNASLAKINAGANQWKYAELVTVNSGGGPGKEPFTLAEQKAVAAALRAQPGSTSYLTIAKTQVSLAGVRQPMSVDAYSADAAGLGWDITAGTWYTGPGQMVVNTAEPELGAHGHPRAGPRLRRVQGRRDDAPPDHRHGHLLGRRSGRAGRGDRASVRYAAAGHRRARDRRRPVGPRGSRPAGRGRGRLQRRRAGVAGPGRSCHRGHRRARPRHLGRHVPHRHGRRPT
jgi:hypothetical protein